MNSSFELPACVCGRFGEWSIVDTQKRNGFVTVSWSCRLCGRPALFITHQGGNVFAVPKVQVEHMPLSVTAHLANRIFPMFRKNAEHLECLREQYELKRYQELCLSLKTVDVGSSWHQCNENLQFALSVQTAEIYLEEGWDEPEGFTPVPIPEFCKEATLFLYDWERPQKESPRKIWYQVIPKKI